MKIDKKQLEEKITSLLHEDEYIIDITFSPNYDGRVILDSLQGITIARCAEISRAITNYFDREKQDFSLEVSTSGLTTPYRHPIQYKKNIGKPISVILRNGEKIEGILESANEKDCIISYLRTIPSYIDKEGKKHKKQTVEETQTIPFDEIKQATYRF